MVLNYNLMGNGPSSATVYAIPDVVPGTSVLGTITPGLNSVTVTWSQPYNAGSALLGYRVYYGTSAAPSVTYVTAAAVEGQAVVSGLSAATPYYFRLVAINAAGAGAASSDGSVTTTDVAPSAPSLGTPARHLNSMTLSWTAPATNGGSPITGYQVFFGKTSAFEVQYGTTLPASTLTVEIGGLDASTAYHFSVVAINAAGAGLPSADASASTTDIVPGSPTMLMSNLSQSLTSITVNWTVPAANGGSPVTGYELCYRTSQGTMAKYGSTLAADASNVSVTGLQPGTTYYFVVRAVNAAGTSADSYMLATNTWNIVPGAPMGISAVPGLFNITLSWSAPLPNGGSPVTGYRVYRIVGTDAVLLVSLGNVTHCLDSGFGYNVSRSYRVSAVNAQGESIQTVNASVISLFPPPPVTGLNVTRGINGAVLVWTQPTGNDTNAPVVRYAIFRGTAADNLQLVDRTDGVTGTYVDMNASSGQTYYYRVAAMAGPTYSDEATGNSVILHGQPAAPVSTDWGLIGGAIVAALAVTLLLFYVLLKKRKKGAPKK